jgi:hypothetical protein
LDDLVFKPAGEKIPDLVRIGVGSLNGRKTKTLGVCFSQAASEQKTIEITLNPTLNDSQEVLAVICHEVIHAVDNDLNGTSVWGHKGQFRTIALAIGLEGKMTSTVAGKDLAVKIDSIIDKIGNYPHATMKFAPAKQGTRLLKIFCDCSFAFRVSAKQANRMLVTDCPCCTGILCPLHIQTEDKTIEPLIEWQANSV